MTIIWIGLAISKHVFQLHGADEDAPPVLRRQLRRRQVAIDQSHSRCQPLRDGGVHI